MLVEVRDILEQFVRNQIDFHKVACGSHMLKGAVVANQVTPVSNPGSPEA